MNTAQMKSDIVTPSLLEAQRALGGSLAGYCTSQLSQRDSSELLQVLADPLVEFPARFDATVALRAQTKSAAVVENLFG